MLAATACVVERVLLGMLAYFGTCMSLRPRAREDDFHGRW